MPIFSLQIQEMEFLSRNIIKKYTSSIFYCLYNIISKNNCCSLKMSRPDIYPTDLEHIIWRALFDLLDGPLLYLLWLHIQRFFLQVPQHLRLLLECGLQVTVARFCSKNTIYA